MKNCILRKISASALIAILALFPAACGSSETESAEEYGNEFIALISENPSESSAEQKGSGIAGDVCESDNNENRGEEPGETSDSDTESDISADETDGENTDISDSRSDAENNSDEDEDIFFTVSDASDSDSDLSDNGSDDTESVSFDTYSDSSGTVSSALSADADPQTCIHNYGIGAVAVNATCIKDGKRIYTCSKCGNTRTETIPATGHTYETSVTKAATCGTDGVRLHKCAVCGDSYTTTITATGNHNWQPVYKTVHHDAEGHYETQKTGMYKCNYSGCGELFETVREAVDHINSVHDGHASYSGTAVETQNWIQDSAAYDEQVIDYYKCSVCGETK